MMTLRLFTGKFESVPAATAWYLAELGEARGKQELFTRQSPQKLKVLREHALIESAISSNRIEGVEVDKSRVATLMFGKPTLRDRDEEEVRGYRDALRLIHEQGAKLPITEATIKKLHKLCRGEIWDAGVYKEKDMDIIQTYADGRSRVRFKTVPAKQTLKAMTEMVELWQRGLMEKWIHPLALVAALNLDFLCIHPFRDGNGRVSRLLFLLACYHCGLEVGRYISLERIVEESKETYYEVLLKSSNDWHEPKHNLSPWWEYFLGTIIAAYKEFEERVGTITTARGAKREMVQQAIKRMHGRFRFGELQKACPGISYPTLKRALMDLKRQKKIRCLGKGRDAEWERIGSWSD